MKNQIRKSIAELMLSPLLSILLIIWLIFLIATLNPFSAAASALEDTSDGIYVHGLPTPVITGIDAENSIVQVKADGYINENSSLLVTVALVSEGGDVVDISERKVSDPENIRVSLNIEKIKVGDNIYAKFTNHGIEGDGTDIIHETQEPPGEPTEEPEPPAEEPEPPAEAVHPQIIIQRVKGSSSVTYVVTEAEPEQIVIEKLVEVEADPEPAVSIIRNVPVYVYSGQDNAHSGSESTDVVAPEIKSEDMAALSEFIEKTKPESEIIKPVSANIKIMISLLIILSLFLIAFIIFMVRYYLSKSFSEVRQSLDLFK